MVLFLPELGNCDHLEKATVVISSPQVLDRQGSHRLDPASSDHFVNGFSSALDFAALEGLRQLLYLNGAPIGS